jgi:hypothetical protein
MNQNHSILIVLTTLLLCSCSTYQYVALEDIQSEPEEKVLLTDSLDISYAFTGDGGIISIEIQNNSKGPVLVDKAKSALIKGGKTISFWNDVSKLNTVSRSEQSYVNDKVYFTDIHGEIINSKSILFIPPESKGTLSGPAVQSSFISIPHDQKTEKVNLPANTGACRARITNFTDEESPAKYRLFLTVTSYGSQSKPVFINKEFRVSSITNCSLSPSNFNKNKGNQFYIRKLTGFGTFMGGMAALGTLIILAASQGD